MLEGAFPLLHVSNISYQCLHVDSHQRKALSRCGTPGPDAYRICSTYPQQLQQVQTDG